LPLTIDPVLGFYLSAKLSKIVAEVKSKMTEIEGEKEHRQGIKESITGLGQKIIGEIETLAGVINADPLAQAEGEFNVEVGTVREGLEETIEEDEEEKK
jgi:hypothetical protein